MAVVALVMMPVGTWALNLVFLHFEAALTAARRARVTNGSHLRFWADGRPAEVLRELRAPAHAGRSPRSQRLR